MTDPTFVYLAAASPELFQIEADGGIWAWKNNDSTAAFAIQLAEILEGISKLLGGLPTITSVLCVASALRQWESDAVWSDRLRAVILYTDPANLAYQASLPRLVKWVGKCASLPAELRKGPQATVSVFGCGLGGRKDLLDVTDPTLVARIVATLRLPAEDRQIFHELYALSDPHFQAHCELTLQTLLHLSDSMSDPTVLETWRQTGLREVPEAGGSLELSSQQTLLEILDGLEQDPIYGGLARYSRNLSGIISLPRQLADPDDLPEGGVSDVANRGTPERLLMTELAADPLLLLARIATGQALYMRRESPPGVQASFRPVLVESSIHCFGMMRVRLGALAFAVARSERQRSKIETEFYTVDSGNYQKINSGSQAGLLELLKRLHPGEHPGEGLIRFFTEQADRLTVENVLAEPLLLITGATSRCSEFARMLAEVKRPVLLGVVERDGSVKVLRHTRAGEQLLQSMQLELTSAQLQPQLKSSSPMPLFVVLPNPPLAFSPADRESAWLADENQMGRAVVWLITQDQRILRFTSHLHGGEEIIDQIPRGKVVFDNVSDSIAEFVLRGTNGNDLWMRVDAEARTLQSSMLGHNLLAMSYGVAGPYLIQFTGGQCKVFHRHDGEQLAEYSTGRRHVGLCYQADAANKVWTHGGGAPHDWHLLGQAEFKSPKLVGKAIVGAVLPAQNRITVVSDNLRWLSYLRSPDERTAPEAVEVSPLLTIPGIQQIRLITGNPARNLWIFAAAMEGTPTTASAQSFSSLYQLDVQMRRQFQMTSGHSSDIVRAAFPTAYNLVRRKPLRRRARAVALTPQGFLFQKTSSAYFLLSIAANEPRRLVISTPKQTQAAKFSTFGEPFTLDSSPHRIWKLSRAELPGGVCWSDSRGLFHFQRADHQDELTLVFTDSHVAGWFSGFGVFGPKFFFPAPASQREEVPLPNVVVHWLRQWFEKAI